MPFEPAIRVERLRKSYGPRVAVADLSFEVRPGAIFALLGPNGAGKTTTVEILEGYRRPDDGTVRVLGVDPAKESGGLLPRVGIMPQRAGVYPQLRPPEALRLFASFYERPRDPLELLRLVDLEDAAEQRFRYLSGGQQQRLSLALALVGRPELVFLDEPTTGMDPQARRATWQLIRGLKSEGVTVVITTHLMDEAEQLADDVAILSRGHLVARGTPAALMASTGRALVRFRAEPEVDTLALSRRVGAAIAPGDGNAYVIDAAPTPRLILALAAGLEEQGALLAELRVGNPSLEEAFLELTRDGRGESA